MSSMATYITIAPTENSGRDGAVQFNPMALHPFDGMRVILEQAIFAAYLKQTASSTHTVDEVIKNIRQFYFQMPMELHGSDSLLNSLYEIGMRIAKVLLDPHPYNAPIGAHPKDLFTIFSQPLMQQYVNREYVPTILESFLKVWVSSFFGWYDQEQYPTGLLHEAVLLVPSSVVLKNYDPRKSTALSNDYGVVINLSPRVFGDFNLGHQTGSLTFFIEQFDMSAYTVDTLIGILAAFSLDHDRYVMTNAAGPGFGIADVCFDLVTGSSYVRPDSAGLIRVHDSYVFFESTKRQIAAGRLRMVEDCELFGELLSKTGASPEIVNYFIKPISLISAAEAFAYRNSELTGFMNDKFIAGVAAIDEGTDSGTGEDGMTETESDGLDPLEGTSTDSVDSGISEEPSSAEADKPQIDPKMMLLEMVRPSETMSDYIYREMVSRRISAILRNPPTNAMPNDLLMLKRWRSRWIYLASVSCLRDFLTRVSIRLSDV